jgi:hypothetical protein
VLFYADEIPNSGHTDIVVSKINTDGTLLWTRQQSSFNTSENDANPNIISDTCGNIYIVYQTDGVVSSGSNTNSGGDKLVTVVFKMDTDGNLLWIQQQPTFNANLNNNNQNINIDTNGNIYVVYQTVGLVLGEETPLSGSYIVIFKMDTNGALLWVKEKALFNTDFNNKNPSVAIDINGHIYVAYDAEGRTTNGTLTGANDIVIFKMDTNGNLIWIKQDSSFNTTQYNYNPSIVVDIIGNAYIVYKTSGSITDSSASFSNFNLAIFKLKPDVLQYF